MGVAAAVAASATAHAGSLTAQGNVQALTNINQMGPIMGTANFDEGPVDQDVPLGTYTAQGLTFVVGALASILPGVTAPGAGYPPFYKSGCDIPLPQGYFPMPIQNGGVCNGNFARGGAAKFTSDITRVGLTAGRNATMYLTVWDQNGVMLGQVTWMPANDASFIGIDTMGVPIGLVTFGNDDVWAGAAYTVEGPTIMADTWVWSTGAPCQNDAACDDGNMCNGAETCAEGSCGGGTPVDCADDDVCTADMCDTNSGCSNQPIVGCCESDADCEADIEVCNVDTNTCEPAGGTSTTDTTDGVETTGTGPGTTTEPETTGTTGTSTTSSTGGSASDSAPGTGEQPTTGAGGTTEAPGGSSSSSSSSTGDSASGGSGVDDGGCGCRSHGGAAPWGWSLLALLGLGRRRRRHS